MPDIADELARAKNLLAESEADDYVVSPRSHADRFQEIPSLVELLETSEIEGRAESFETIDARANRNRDEYFAHAKRANALVLASAVLGALITAAIAIGGPMVETISEGGTARQALTNPWVLAFSITTALVAGWSAFLLSRLNSGAYLSAWMTARAEAEAERLGFFQTLTNPKALLHPLNPPDGPVDMRYHLIAFWYFQRFQIRVQQTYYEQRGADHRRNARIGYNMAAAASAIGVVSALLVPVLSFFVDEYAALFAVVTVSGTALAGYAATREGIAQHQNNAIRYQQTADTLGRLERQTDKVEAAIRLGKADVFRAFVTAVHEQLALEQKQWLEATEKSSEAVQALNEALKDAGASES